MSTRVSGFYCLLFSISKMLATRFSLRGIRRHFEMHESAQFRVASGDLSAIARPFHESLKTLKMIISTSRVSMSRRTISPVSLNFGTAINRTVCPVGPSMTVVSKVGWLPTK